MIAMTVTIENLQEGDGETWAFSRSNDCRQIQFIVDKGGRTARSPVCVCLYRRPCSLCTPCLFPLSAPHTAEYLQARMSKTKVIIPPDLSEFFLQAGGVANVETWQISGRFRQGQGIWQLPTGAPGSTAQDATQRTNPFHINALWRRSGKCRSLRPRLWP